MTTLLALLSITAGFQGPLIFENRGAPDVDIVIVNLTPSPQSRVKKRTRSSSLPREEPGIRDDVQGIAPKHNGTQELEWVPPPLIPKQEVEVAVGVKNRGGRAIRAIRWEITLSDKRKRHEYERRTFSTQNIVAAGETHRFTRTLPMRINWDLQNVVTTKIKRIEYADGSIRRPGR